MCDNLAVLSCHWLAFLFLIQISELFSVASLIALLFSVVFSARRFVVINKQLLADAQLDIAAILWLYFNSLLSFL